MISLLQKFNWIIFFSILPIPFITADNYNDNSYNNHGVVGLINMPTARVFDESDLIIKRL